MTRFNVFFLLLSIFTTFSAKADYAESIFVPTEEMRFAKQFLQAFLDQDFDYVLKHTDQTMSGEITSQNLIDLRSIFPSSEPVSSKLIGSNVHITDDTWQATFKFEYEFEADIESNKWALMSVRIVKEETDLKVIAFRFSKTTASQSELNKFELAGKSALHYLVLLMTVLVFIFILVTVIVCIKTPIPRRKWIWVLFVLGGISSFSLNWTSGVYAFKLIELRLFGVGFGAAGEYSPWIISVSFPLGAILFWLMRNSFIRKSELLKTQAQMEKVEAQEGDVKETQLPR